MSNLTEKQREQLIELLEKGEKLPLDYKHLLFPPERQEYELVFAEKEREEDILAETMAVPLQPIRTFGSDGSKWHNMLIFGDNLQAMKTLLKMKDEGRLINTDGSKGVKLVYIDPPFATKREFQGAQEERAYQDKIAGAKFIEFLRKRLILIKALLASDGSIYVHLDYRKGHYIKVVLDEILGETQFVNQIIWKRTSAHSDSKTLGNAHDIILHYGRSKDIIYNKQFMEYSEEYIKKYYKHKDSNGRFLDRDLTAKGLKGRGYEYEWKGIKGYWRCPIETMQYYDEQGLLYYTKKGTPRLKQYLKDKKGSSLQDIWVDINAINSQAVERVGYPTQKPEALLQRIIKASTSSGDIVLDAFVGSGTTMAVAEKLSCRWIGIDCSKLAIYTIQKRMLNLKRDIGNKGKVLRPKPFTLYNAGLYDFSQLKQLPWEDWRFFALNLFQCRDEPHKVRGIHLDGYRGGDDVLVFNHTLGDGVVLDYGFIDDLQSQIGSKLGSHFFIIAPAASVAFLEDYVDKGRTRYYILRIPYSIINELHTRDFEAITQPVDEFQINETVEAVGFDFIRQPKVECDYYIHQASGQLFKNAVVKIKTFKSVAMAKGASQKKNRETLSMVLVDYDYPYNPNRKGKEPPPPFEMDATFYAKEIESNKWEVRMPFDLLKNYVMLVYVDIYGNEYTEIKTPADFRSMNSKIYKKDKKRTKVK